MNKPTCWQALVNAIGLGVHPPLARADGSTYQPPLNACAPVSSFFPGDTIDFLLPVTSAAVNPINVSIQLKAAGPNLSPIAQVNATPVALPSTVYAQGCSATVPTTFSVTIGDSWPSGFYKVTLIDSANPSTTTFYYFVVRARPSTSKGIAIAVLPLATWHAYNYWGGASLYSGPSATGGYIDAWDGLSQSHFSHQVAVDRPGWGWQGGGQANPMITGYPLFFEDVLGAINLIESELGVGYVDYATSIELTDSSLLPPYNLMISVGHDEYWSKEMRDNVENFVRWAGGNVCFFGANTSWWQIRFENRSADGTLVNSFDTTKICCYKMDGQPVRQTGYDYSKDPMWFVDQSRITTHWHAPTVNRPENQMTGVSYRNGAYYNGGGCNAVCYTANYPNHWVFNRPAPDSSGYQPGVTFSQNPQFGNVQIPGLRPGQTPSYTLFDVSPEWDAADLNGNSDAPEASGLDGSPLNFLPLASAQGGANPYSQVANSGRATMGIFRNNGVVFSAGILGWRYGMIADWKSANHDFANFPEIAFAQISANLLQRLSQKSPFKYENELGNAYFESWSVPQGQTVTQPNNWAVEGGGSLGIGSVTEGAPCPITGNHTLDVNATQGSVSISQDTTQLPPLWMERYTNYQIGVVVKASAPGAIAIYLQVQGGPQFAVSQNQTTDWETVFGYGQMNHAGPMFGAQAIMVVNGGATASFSDIAVWEMPTLATWPAGPYSK